MAYLAGTQGLEPRYADPESAVLPLDDVPRLSYFSIGVWGRLATCAPIANRRKLRGLPTRAQDSILPHHQTDPLPKAHCEREPTIAVT